MSAASPDIPLFVLHGGRLWLEGELSTISSPGFLSHGRELLPGSLGASPAVDCLQSLPSGVLHPVPLRRFLRPTPSRIAFWVPAGAFPVDSRCQQRNIALHHIPPLPILEYALGSQLSTFPASRSRVNPKCTQAIDPGALSSTLTPAHLSRPSRSPWHFTDFPWSGSPWSAHGSPLDGDWIPNFTRLMLGPFCCPIYPAQIRSQPRDAPFPFATSGHWG